MAEDGIVGEIAAALRRAFAALGDDESRIAFHCGEAGGIAAAAGIFGVKALELCDDISDAYENGDWDFLRYVLSELMDRPDDNGEEYARTREAEIGWDAFGAALSDALRSLDESNDPVRYSVMIGFVSGLMFRDPGPTYDASEVVRGIAGYHSEDHPESNESVRDRVAAAVGPDRDSITIRDGIVRGHEEDCRELIEWARMRVAAGLRMSDPMAFMSADRAARYYEEQVRTMRWAQNFGLRNARARDESVSIPNSMAINYSLVRGGGDEPEDDDGNHDR